MRKAAFLCVVLLLAVFLLVSCSNTDAENIRGTWKTAIDYSEELKSELGDSESYFEIDTFKLDMCFTFKEDGTYVFELADDGIEDARESLRGPLKQGIIEMFESVAATLSMTVEDYLQTLGQSVDGVVDEMISSLDIGGFADAVRTEGYYYIGDGKLYISSSREANLDPDVYYALSFTGRDSFELTGIVGDDGGLLDFPAEFTKVK